MWLRGVVWSTHRYCISSFAFWFYHTSLYTNKMLSFKSKRTHFAATSLQTPVTLSPTDRRIEHDSFAVCLRQVSLPPRLDYRLPWAWTVVPTTNPTAGVVLMVIVVHLANRIRIRILVLFRCHPRNHQQQHHHHQD